MSNHGQRRSQRTTQGQIPAYYSEFEMAAGPSRRVQPVVKDEGRGPIFASTPNVRRSSSRASNQSAASNPSQSELRVTVVDLEKARRLAKLKKALQEKKAERARLMAEREEELEEQEYQRQVELVEMEAEFDLAKIASDDDMDYDSDTLYPETKDEFMRNWAMKNLPPYTENNPQDTPVVSSNQTRPVEESTWMPKINRVFGRWEPPPESEPFLRGRHDQARYRYQEPQMNGHRETEQSGIDSLVHVLAEALGRVTNTQQTVPGNNREEKIDKLLARQSVSKDLPEFNGNPEDWPRFIARYTQSSELCQFTDSENISRLEKCLKGKAKDTVKALMVLPENLPKVIATLEINFGRSDIIISSLIEKAKTASQVKEDKPETMVEFGNVVRNLVTSIETLKLPGYLQNPTLVKELEGKLPGSTKMMWGMIKAKRKGLATLKDFSEFVEEWALSASYLQEVSYPSEKPNLKSTKEGKKKDEKVYAIADEVENVCTSSNGEKYTGCHHCEKKGHWIRDCRTFAALNVEERWKSVKSKKLCFGCLSPGHSSSQCRIGQVCGKEGCDKSHHPLLHKSSSRSRSTSPKNERRNNSHEQQEYQGHPVGHSTGEGRTLDQTLLKVIPVVLKGPKGSVKTFAFLDEGATISMIESSTAEKLGLDGKVRPLCIQWTNGVTRTENESREVSGTITGDYAGAKSFGIRGLRTVKGLDLPCQTIDKSMFKKYPHLHNTNVQPFTKGKPTMLIGSDNLPLIVSRQVIHGNYNEPHLSKTWLGWVVHGKQLKGRLDAKNQVHFCYSTATDEVLHELVKDSFRTESFGVKVIDFAPRSKEDKRAKAVMENTTRRVGQRWETGLLWKDKNLCLPESYSQALKRLNCLENKFAKDEKFQSWYNDKIQDYVNKGYVRKLTDEEAKVETPMTWYLPHFAAYQEKKPDKPRLVFDAAAKSYGVSLNDMLVKGPDLYNPLPSVLFKFRQRQFGFSADIAEMFHQVKMREDDRQSQRFLWGRNEDGIPHTYVMEVMTFGATSSPCSATYCKNKNAEEYKEEFPEAYTAIVNRHYVDDYLDSSDTVGEGISLCQDVIEVHKRGGFNICKFRSSSKEILLALPEALRADDTKSLEPMSELPTGQALGLWWDQDKDEFTWQFNFSKVDPEIISGEKIPTKREVLRVVMSLFDPLGFLTHYVIRAKILLQDIWRSELGWDDELSYSLNCKWQAWLSQLKELGEQRIPRCYSSRFSKATEKELHVFCDASEQAFCAVAYFRIADGDEITVSFVAGKSRVSPLKTLSIPRLELQAAVMGSRLAKNIHDEHEIKVHKTVYWTDSRTVLCWIRADAKRFKPFVSHRIGEIEELTNGSEWRWVPTAENVADDATRETYPCDLSSKSRWLIGPSFLISPTAAWPVEQTSGADDIDEQHLELKNHNVNVTLVKESIPVPDIERFSSWSKLIRSTGWMKRFLHNLKVKREERLTGELSPVELAAAEEMLCKKAQFESYPDQVNCLSIGNCLKKRDSLFNLSPYIDDGGIMRVYGRMDNAELVIQSAKRPVILDCNHPISRLIINYYHQKNSHQGIETVMNEVRQKFWIVHLRNAVKKEASNCRYCKIRRALPRPPEMGQLPAVRTKGYEHPFSYTGMDYFGPMTVTIGRRHEKRYGVLFTCLTTRAVHLEIAASLTTDSAVMAIRRMMSRRGCPKEIFSDNGTNLRGADEEMQKALKDFDPDVIQQKMALLGVKWSFIPPSAPHMGGAWERMVRSVKVALKVILKERSPREEVLQTLLAEAEAIVNSHPLTHVSVDPNDPQALTPNHFLVGRSSGQQAPGLFDDKDLCLRKMWRTAQRLADMFWSRWVKEYLPTLTRKSKWIGQPSVVKVGDVVVVVDDTAERNSWPLGVITAVFPGKDSKVRVVDVRTSSGTYRRPVAKICVLDVN